MLSYFKGIGLYKVLHLGVAVIAHITSLWLLVSSCSNLWTNNACFWDKVPDIPLYASGHNFVMFL